jgi:hypothetical protein
MPQGATDQEVSWLEEYFQRASIRDSNKIGSITRFALIWNLFEGEVCHGSFSIGRIEESLQKLGSRDDLRAQDFEPHLKYFKERYITDGATNHLYGGLNFSPNDKEPLVASVLLGRKPIRHYRYWRSSSSSTDILTIFSTASNRSIL